MHEQHSHLGLQKYIVHDENLLLVMCPDILQHEYHLAVQVDSPCCGSCIGASGVHCIKVWKVSMAHVSFPLLLRTNSLVYTWEISLNCLQCFGVMRYEVFIRKFTCEFLKCFEVFLKYYRILNIWRIPRELFWSFFRTPPNRVLKCSKFFFQNTLSFSHSISYTLFSFPKLEYI